ncbi:MAG: ion channel [Actinomycetota bacterium]|nr:ion channel [Actinomycetota bacterium]
MAGATADPHPHSAAVRRRARHVWLLALWRRKGVRSGLRLSLLAAYSITFMWGAYLEWEGATQTVVWLLGAVLWIAVLALYLREIATAANRRRYLARHLSLPLLLVAPALLWFTWFPLGAFLVVVVAYVLELRNHSAGDGFLFSFGLVVFIGIFAGLSMVEIENDNPDSSLKSPSDALFWSFASLLKINYGKAMSPETHDGRILATVVGVCAILGASLFTAQIVSWVVGGQKDQVEADEADEAEEAGAEAGDATPADVQAQLAAIRAELAALRETIAAGLPGSAGDDGPRVQ